MQVWQMMGRWISKCLKIYDYPFQGIWSHKLCSFLTMLGIIIGIAAIIAIVSTIEGTNELIKQNMMGNNRHTVKVQLSQDDYTYEISTWNPSPEGVPLFDEDTRQEILQIPNVLRAAFYQVRSEYNSVVFYNKQSLSSCTVLGIDQYYFGTAGYQIMQGREIIQEDSKKKRQVAVIDESVLRTLFPDEDPIGKTIEIYGEPFTVVGVCTQVGQSELVINSEEEYWTYIIRVVPQVVISIFQRAYGEQSISLTKRRILFCRQAEQMRWRQQERLQQIS